MAHLADQDGCREEEAVLQDGLEPHPGRHPHQAGPRSLEPPAATSMRAAASVWARSMLRPAGCAGPRRGSGSRPCSGALQGVRPVPPPWGFVPSRGRDSEWARSRVPCSDGALHIWLMVAAASGRAMPTRQMFRREVSGSGFSRQSDVTEILLLHHALLLEYVCLGMLGRMPDAWQSLLRDREWAPPAASSGGQQSGVTQQISLVCSTLTLRAWEHLCSPHCSRSTALRQGGQRRKQCAGQAAPGPAKCGV